MEKGCTQILSIVEWCVDHQSPDGESKKFNDVFDLVYLGFYGGLIAFMHIDSCHWTPVTGPSETQKAV